MAVIHHLTTYSLPCITTPEDPFNLVLNEETNKLSYMSIKQDGQTSYLTRINHKFIHNMVE